MSRFSLQGHCLSIHADRACRNCESRSYWSNLTFGLQLCSNWTDSYQTTTVRTQWRLIMLDSSVKTQILLMGLDLLFLHFQALNETKHRCLASSFGPRSTQNVVEERHSDPLTKQWSDSSWAALEGRRTLRSIALLADLMLLSLVRNRIPCKFALAQQSCIRSIYQVAKNGHAEHYVPRCCWAPPHSGKR